MPETPEKFELLALPKGSLHYVEWVLDFHIRRTESKVFPITCSGSHPLCG